MNGYTSSLLAIGLLAGGAAVLRTADSITEVLECSTTARVVGSTECQVTLDESGGCVADPGVPGIHFRFVRAKADQETSSINVRGAVFYIYRRNRDSLPYEAKLHRVEMTCDCGHAFEGKPSHDEEEVVRCPCCRRGYACQAESTDAADRHRAP